MISNFFLFGPTLCQELFAVAWFFQRRALIRISFARSYWKTRHIFSFGWQCDLLNFWLNFLCLSHFELSHLFLHLTILFQPLYLFLRFVFPEVILQASFLLQLNNLILPSSSWTAILFFSLSLRTSSNWLKSFWYSKFSSVSTNTGEILSTFWRENIFWTSKLFLYF